MKTKEYKSEIGKLYQSKRDELKALLAKYKQHTKLHTNDEFNRGWVSAFCCVVEDLEKLIK